LNVQPLHVSPSRQNVDGKRNDQIDGNLKSDGCDIDDSVEHSVALLQEMSDTVNKQASRREIKRKRYRDKATDGTDAKRRKRRRAKGQPSR
jgi:hypothetical protein